MSFLTLLRETFSLLLKHPKLFVPNYVMGFFTGLLKLWGVALLLTLGGGLASVQSGATPPPLPEGFLASLTGYLVFSFVLILIGLAVNAMYPILVDAFRRQTELSLKSAFISSLHKLPKLILVTLLLIFLFFTLSIALALSYFFAVIFWPLPLQALAGFIVLFALVYVFYFVYPVTVLEKSGVFSTFSRSVGLSRTNPWEAGQAGLLSTVLLGISYVLSAFQDNPGALALFWGLQFAISTLSTYLYVLNPLVYLEVRED